MTVAGGRRVDKWSTRVLVAACLFLVTIIGIASLHYKTLILNPVTAWHGSYMGLRSFTSDTSGSLPSYSPERLKELAILTERKMPELSADEVELVPNLSMSRNEMRNLVAANQMRDNKFRRDMEAVDKANKQLLSSQANLNSLSKDYSAALAHQQAEIAQRQSIADAIAKNEEAPSEADADALVNQRGQSLNRGGNTISPKVLNKVQENTGISPEEINRLMNQQVK